jgi:hypothetical protein|tara:strand:- start:128 stop:700 length:573 start_codon:yes stop_codon:yes gene_type:complete
MKGIVFAQIRANISSIKTGLPTKIINLFDSEDKVTKYLDVSGDQFKQLFYTNTKFNMPTENSDILGDFCYLDQWCSSTNIGEIIKPPYFFDFINTVLISWQKDLDINICDWDQINNKRLYKELQKINGWVSNTDHQVIKSLDYTELINILKTPKLTTGNLIHLSITIMNDHPKVSNIELILNFRINKNET